MNYLAEGINNGARMGAEAYLMRRRMQQEEKARQQALAEQRADRDLRLRMALQGMEHEGSMLSRRLDAEAGNLRYNKEAASQLAADERAARAAEAAADRALREKLQGSEQTWRTNERVASQEAEFDPANPRNQALGAQMSRLNAEAAAYNAKAKSLESPVQESDPYSEEVKRLQNENAKYQIAMAGGDRGGFLGFNTYEKKIAENNRKIAAISGMNAPQSAPMEGAAPSFGPEYEGKVVQGPDGTRYIIKNGQPIPVQ